MYGIAIEMKFNAAVSRLVAALKQEDPRRVLDGTGTVLLLAALKPRTVRVIAADLEAWLSWWQGRARQASGALHESIPAYTKFLAGSGVSQKTIVRYRYSIRRVLAALGCPADEQAVACSFQNINGHSMVEMKRLTDPKVTPFGWDKIRKCVRWADPGNRREVTALAGMLVLYEAMAWSDQIFGHYSGGTWHVPPARRDDLKWTPDGGARLRLVPMKRGDTARYAVLSPLVTEWIGRAHSFGESHDQSLLTGNWGHALLHHTWDRWVKGLISRSGMDAGKFTSASLRLGMAKDLEAAGFTVGEVLEQDGWATRFPIRCLIHGESAGGITYMTPLHPKWMQSSRSNYLPCSPTGRKYVVSQMSFPGI